MSLPKITKKRGNLEPISSIPHFARNMSNSLPYKTLRFLLLFFVVGGFAFPASAQNFQQLNSITPTDNFENTYVKKVAEDSLQSSFIIWIKKDVKEHFHADHSESIYVLEGEGMMSLGDDLFLIKTGDYVFIPKGTPHSVTQVMGDLPLKVLSIQAPIFDGSDRIFVQELESDK